MHKQVAYQRWQSCHLQSLLLLVGVAAAVAVVGKVDKLETTHPYGETHLEYTEHLSITAFNSFPCWRPLLLSADNLCKQFGPR